MKKTLIILAGFLLLAIAINLAVLEFFDQKSAYRATHSLIGIIVLMGFVYTFSSDVNSKTKLIGMFLVSLIPCYLGTVVSDLDISLLGIGSHRNPVFHSGIAFFLLLLILRQRQSVFLATLVAAFGVGLGSHLIWDLFDKADVRWIPGGALDRLWLGVNGLLCLILAKQFLSKRTGKTSTKMEK